MDHRPTRQSAPKFKFAADQLSNAELDRYEFIVGSSVDRATIDRASLIAGAWNVMPHDVLLALGWITPEDYIAKLADALGVGHAFSGQRRETDRDVDATTQRPSNVASEVERSRRFATRVCLTTHLRPEATLSAVQRAQYADTAINSLRLGMPSSSAATRVYFWQFLTVFSGLGLFLGAALVDRWLVYVLLAFLAAVPFAFVVALRLNALLVYWRHRHPRLRKRLNSESRRVPSAELPVYSILVPLFQEADVLRDLLAALLHLDYPSAKLDVILILEASDSETQGAVANTSLPGFVRVVIVPDLQPRTKPKALNYAIQFARGEFVVVYDAEDVPDPDQLREAIQAFTENPEIDCLQARLNIYNPSENWLTAQFALEYTTLFDGLLPSLDRLGLPIPLGGTSNHFRGIRLFSCTKFSANQIEFIGPLATQFRIFGQDRRPDLQ